MAKTSYIGLVDLTTRLSSMNPNGIYSNDESWKLFKLSLRRAGLSTLSKSSCKELIKHQMFPVTDPFPSFQFFEQSDLFNFVSTLRRELLSKALPFKIIVTTGNFKKKNDFNNFSAALENVNTIDELDGEYAEYANKEFDALSIKEIKELISAVGNIGTDTTSHKLVEVAEEFKGNGTYFCNPIIFDNIYKNLMVINYYPKRAGKQVDYIEYIDYKLDNFNFSCEYFNNNIDGENYGISSYKDEDTKIIVDHAVNMMFKSSQINKDDGMYYISFINLIILSSNFSEFFYKTEDKTENKIEYMTLNENNTYRPGWQKIPYIFNYFYNNRMFEKRLNEIPGSHICYALFLKELINRLKETDDKNTLEYGNNYIKGFSLKEEKRRILRKIFTLPENIAPNSFKSYINQW